MIEADDRAGLDSQWRSPALAITTGTNRGLGLTPASGGPALKAVSHLSVSLYWRGE